MVVINIGMIILLICVGLWVYQVVSGNNALWISKVIMSLAGLMCVFALMAKLWLGAVIWGIVAFMNSRRVFHY
tara:strand:- start:551 stop:769 length:219 start_codon:yes stop_codon:yes gene_type:complete